MATLTEKLKVYKSANATTYSANIYDTAAEASNSPLMVNVNGDDGYVTATTNPDDPGIIPLRIDKEGTTYYVKEAGYVEGEITFNSSGTFIVPAGVTTLYVTAAAGGGGGGGGSRYYTYSSGSGESSSTSTYHNPGGYGGNGGTTSLGTLVTLTGGNGGGRGYGNSNGGQGSNGSPYAGVVNSSYGIGGSGGYGQGYGGAGGNGGTCLNYEVSVSEGEELPVLIGAGGSGGSGGASGYQGSSGLAGYMHIRW